MENENNKKLIDFTLDGRLEVIKECFPGLTEEEGIKQLSTFISYIILK